MAKQTNKAVKKAKSSKRRLGLAKFIKPNKKNKKKGPKPEKEDEKHDLEKNYPVVSKKTKGLSLVDKCKQQMAASLLRLYDEKLYTHEAGELPFDKNKFLAYHEAYATVSENWPTKPIDYIVKFIKRHFLAKKPLHKYKFADVGCGSEPLLKKKLPSKANVVSFDIVSAHEDVIEANMQHLPIEDNSIDVAVYSLSLMAKNLGQIILEARRILKIGGSMLIVEVTSRFEGRERGFVERLEKVGLRKKSMSALKPNEYFTFFHFTKEDSKNNYSHPNIQLKPCVYKAR